MSVKIKGNSLPLTFYALTAYLKYFSVVRKAQRHFVSLESSNMNHFIEIISDSIEIDFLAQTCKCFHVPWVIPHMCGGLFWNVEYLLLIPGRICSKWWEEPLWWGKMGGRKKTALFGWSGSRFLLCHIHCSRDESHILHENWGGFCAVPTRAGEVSGKSIIVCHVPLMSFITCPSTRLPNDSASLDIPNSHRRGLLVLILQELV